ncbi:unnamed protein product [Alopecurus aequalis]
MKIKKLTPMDSEARRLIDWLEKGVYDALQNKYLKALLFLICEKEEGKIIEEYTFSFTYPDLNHDDVVMSVSGTGRKKISATFKSNAAKATPDQLRSSACKMIRTVVSLVCSLDELPDERMIQMKLLYYEEVTPNDYEAPLFEPCSDDTRSNAHSKHLLLAVKINTLLDPYMLSNDNTGGATTIPEAVCKQHEFLSFSEANLVKRFELCCISKRAPHFHLDSGASFHVCNNRDYMKNLKPIPAEKRIELKTADGQTFVPEEIGTLRFQNINLSQVMLIPLSEFNVISVGQLDEESLLISVAGGQFLVIDVQNSIIIGEGYKDTKSNDYIFRGINWEKPDPEDTSDQNLLFEDIEPAETDSEKDTDYEVDPNSSDKEKDEDYNKWVIDSCSACHLTGRKDLLTNIRSSKEAFRGPKSVISCTHSGIVKIENLHLSKVMYSPKARKNLVSVPILEGEGYRFTFYAGKCGIVCKGTLKECGFGIKDKRNNLYYLTEFIPEKGAVSTKRKR